jgi:hypothetical protein
MSGTVIQRIMNLYKEDWLEDCVLSTI